MKQLMYGADRVRSKKLTFLFADERIYRLCFQQLLIVLFNYAGIDFLQLQGTDNR